MAKNEQTSTKKIYQLGMLLLAIAMVASLLMAFIRFSKSGGGDTPADNSTVKVKDRTDLYQIANDPTPYMRELYEELARICNSTTITAEEDLSDMAGAVAKCFISDYFTWSNKRGSYDVGGLDYVFGPTHSNFAHSARRYFYYDLDLLMNQYGVDNLPTVSNINITSVEKQANDYQVTTEVYDYSTNQTYNEVTEYPFYLVKATWDYELPAESGFDASRMPAEGNLAVVLRDGRLEVAYYHKDYVR